MSITIIRARSSWATTSEAKGGRDFDEEGVSGRREREIGRFTYAGLHRNTGIAKTAETGERRGWVEDRGLVKEFEMD